MTLFRLALPALLSSTLAVAGGADSALPGAVSVGGCVPGFVQPSPAALERQLRAARARWAASGIQSYRFDFDQIAQPVRFARTSITVLPGERLKAVTTDRSPASTTALGATMRGLFDNIQQSVAFVRRQPCAELKVSYAQDGHPLSLSLEQRNINIADGGASWTVSSFRRLK
jgi:Family of unknown function (DUF6174)